jgi:hypothetical protein
MTDGTLVMKMMEVEIPTIWVEIPMDTKVESPLRMRMG